MYECPQWLESGHSMLSRSVSACVVRVSAQLDYLPTMLPKKRRENPAAFPKVRCANYGLAGLLLLSEAMIAITPATTSTAIRIPNVPIPARSSDFATGEPERASLATGAAATAVEPRTIPTDVKAANNFRNVIIIPFRIWGPHCLSGSACQL